MTDLISRADAVKAILIKREETKGVWFGGMSEAIDVINELPSVRPTGEWTEDEIPCEPYEPIAIVECSECGYRLSRQTWKENTFNYCPSCGADMRGGD